jgi:hypothetical protein
MAMMMFVMSEPPPPSDAGDEMIDVTAIDTPVLVGTWEDTSCVAAVVSARLLTTWLETLVCAAVSGTATMTEMRTLPAVTLTLTSDAETPVSAEATEALMLSMTVEV